MKAIKSFRITEANQKRLTKLAKLDGRSESYIIDAALDMYLNALRTQPLTPQPKD